MNIVKLLKTIHKLKAGLSVVIADNKQLIKSAKYQYWTNCSLDHEINEEKEENIEPNEFL